MRLYGAFIYFPRYLHELRVSDYTHALHSRKQLPTPRSALAMHYNEHEFTKAQAISTVSSPVIFRENMH